MCNLASGNLVCLKVCCGFNACSQAEHSVVTMHVCNNSVNFHCINVDINTQDFCEISRNMCIMCGFVTCGT